MSNQQHILFNASKKAIKDRLDISVKDDDLFNVINHISSNDPSLSNKDKLRLILDHYGGAYSKETEKTLESAVQELEMIRNQPVIVSPPSSIPATIPATTPIPNIPTPTSISNTPNTPNSPNYFNISVPPKPKKYLKTFIINSEKRNWIDDPLRSRFVYEFPNNTSITPKILSFPENMLDKIADIPIIILKITNTNAKLIEYHFYPQDIKKQVWKTLDGIQPYSLGLRDNISTVGLYDSGDFPLILGKDNDDSIQSFERIDDSKCKIVLSLSSRSSFIMICRDNVYKFLWLYDNIYEYYEPITFDVINTPHNILVRNQQFSIICSYT